MLVVAADMPVSFMQHKQKHQDQSGKVAGLQSVQRLLEMVKTEAVQYHAITLIAAASQQVSRMM